MDQINPAGLSSVSTVDPLHKSTLGAADAAAAKTTRLQAKNRPWTCSKRDVRVTNAQCLAAHLAGKDRACRECSIPNILPKCEETKVPSVKKGICESCGDKNVLVYLTDGKRLCHACRALQALPKAQPTDELQEPKQPAETARSVEIPPSWDDFTPLDTRAPVKALTPYAVLSRGKLTFSRAAIPSIPFHPGDFVEIRYSQDKQALALRKAEGPASDSRKLTDDGASRLNLSILHHIRVWGLPSGHYEIEAVPWGVLVHFSKPIAPPTKRGVTEQAA